MPPRRGRAAPRPPLASRSISKPSPVQNSSVATHCAPGIIRASVVFPAHPWPADPDQHDRVVRAVRPRSGPASAVRPSAHGTLSGMEKLRLGGMALSNGVLVHGPTSWGAAVRAQRRVDPDAPRARSGASRANVSTPFLRGPLRLAEAFAVLPDVRRALPEARFPFERPRVAVTVIVGAAAAGIARRSRLSLPAARGDRRARIACAGRPRAERRRARLVPRGRAHLDRHVRNR